MPNNFVTMGFPSEGDGEISVTVEELQYLLKENSVTIRAKYIRSVTLTKLAKFYQNSATVQDVQNA